MSTRGLVLRAFLLAIVSFVATGFDCSGGPSSGPQGQTTWSHPSGTATVTVSLDPFALVIKDASGNVLLESTPNHDDADPSSPLRAYAPIGLTHNVDETVPVPMTGWDYYRGQDNPWMRVTSAQ